MIKRNRRNTMSRAKKIIDSLNEAEPKIDAVWISKVLKGAGVEFKSVKKVSSDEFQVEWEKDFIKKGTAWDKLEDKCYKALEKAGWEGEDSKVSIFL